MMKKSATTSLEDLRAKAARHLNTTKRFREYDGTSTFMMLTVKNPVRQLCIRMVQSSWFDNTILCVILINSVFLALDNPLNSPSATERTVFLVAEIIFTIVFTVELCVKVVAMGWYFNGPGAYIRDPWNILDFVVVVVALLSNLPFLAAAELTAIRLVRLLRPLRTINTNESIKVLVTALLSAIPQMSDVLFLLTIVFWTFALVGMQFFSGAFRQSCYNTTTTPFTLVTSRSTMCSGGSSAFRCDANEKCLPDNGNPNGGMIGFDNIGQSLLTIFVATTMEGWTDTMYYTFETVSYAGVLYFIALMVLGTFFVMQLVTAVIVNCYQQTKEQQERLMADLLANNTTTNKTLPPVIRPTQVAPEPLPPPPVVMMMTAEMPKPPTLRQLKSEARLERQASIQDYLSERMEHGTPATKWCLRLATHRHTEYAIIVLIFINTVFMASEHANQPQYWTTTLDVANYVFTTIFVLEMACKLKGLGWWGYTNDHFNRFDAVIVCANVVEIIVVLSTGSSSDGLAALRTFRLLRAFKIARHWKNLHHLLATISSSLPSVANFTVLMSLFVFIYAVMGMQLFAGRLMDVADSTETARANFDSFLWSLVTVFQILTGENWNEVMQSGITGTTWWASAYFVSLFIFGNMILLNLFLAILLSSFDDDEEEALADNAVLDFGDKLQQQETEDAKATEVAGLDREDSLTIIDSDDDGAAGAGGGGEDVRGSQEMMPVRANKLPKLREEERLKLQLEAAMNNNEKPTTSTSTSGGSSNDDDDISVHKAPPAIITTRIIDLTSSGRMKDEKSQSSSSSSSSSTTTTTRPSSSSSSRACFCFGSESRVRLAVIRMTQHSVFNNFILAVIIISTVLLACDDPTSDTQPTVLVVLDLTTTIIFTIEAALRIYALGVFMHDGAYFRDPWNRMDFAIVVVSLIDLVVPGSSFSFLRAFRATRALRPLRLVRRMPGLRVVVESILQAVPYIMNVLLVSLMFYVTFGVLGIQLFAGKFQQCENDTSGDVVYVNKTVCEQTAGVSWKSSALGNFDNIFNAVLILFEVATGEMWPNIMYRAIDTTAPGEAPQRDNHKVLALYFITFIIVSNFVLLNLVLGAVVDTFNEMKEKITGFGALTPRQKMWLEVRKLFLYARGRRDPTIPATASVWRRHVFHVVQHHRFEATIIGLIILNMVVLSMQYYGQSDSYTTVLQSLNYMFTFVFLGEALLKIYGLGAIQYFQSGWNRFDFTLVCASLFAFAFNVAGVNLLFDPKVLRVFRIPRILRLVEQLSGVRRLVQTLQYALDALFNIGGLMVLIFFMYAVMGMSLFGGMRHESFINVHNNFDNIGTAMLLLFRSATGESWNGMMHEIQRNGNGTARVLAAPYFVSFTVVGSFLLLNLFVAVIMEGFDDVGSGDDETAQQSTVVTLETLTIFSKEWDALAEHRPWWMFWARGRSEWLNTKHLLHLFSRVPAPMGLKGKEYSTTQQMLWVESMCIPVYERRVTHTVRELMRDTDDFRIQDGQRLDDLVDVQEWYVHYFEVISTVAYHAFKMKNNAKLRSALRQQLRAARHRPMSAQPVHVSDSVEDDVDKIPPHLDAVASIQERLAHRYRHLATIARKAAVHTGLPQSQSIPNVPLVRLNHHHQQKKEEANNDDDDNNNNNQRRNSRWEFVRQNVRRIAGLTRRHRAFGVQVKRDNKIDVYEMVQPTSRCVTRHMLI